MTGVMSNLRKTAGTGGFLLTTDYRDYNKVPLILTSRRHPSTSLDLLGKLLGEEYP